MTWIYSQESGKLKWGDQVIGTGYSGHGDGKNSPAHEDVPNVGPIPRGTYEIGSPFDTETHGPFVMRLSPSGSTYTFGRSGFLIHGDSIKAPGTASEGCIILARSIRERIASSQDNQLTVI